MLPGRASPREARGSRCTQRARGATRRKSSRVGPAAACLAWALLACGAGAPLTDAALEGGVDAADAGSQEASSAAFEWYLLPNLLLRFARQ